MPATSILYRGATRAARWLLPAVGPLLGPKVVRGHVGRAAARDTWLAWAATGRDLERRLVWVHASSVGEGLQAEAVIDALHRRRPEWQVIFTHFSPSAEALAARIHVDAAGYLPYDLPDQVEPLLERLRPDALVFSKLDLWPELATRAARRGTAVLLVGGTVRAGSGRLRWPARSHLAPGYRAVAHAGAVADDDAERLVRLGLSADAVSVLGDPRYDSVAARVAAVPPDDAALIRLRAPDTLVAGSTWPADERVLLPAFATIRSECPSARLILAPHEPTPRHLAAVEAQAAALGLPRPVRLEAATAEDPLVLVDRVGILAVLYGAGTMAYVGGGIGGIGLHSVLEPAAWGLPLAMGPEWDYSRDAALLLAAKAAEPLPADDMEAAMVSIWRGWLADEGHRAAQGARARDMVVAGLGAAERAAEMVEAAVAGR